MRDSLCRTWAWYATCGVQGTRSGAEAWGLWDSAAWSTLSGLPLFGLARCVHRATKPKRGSFSSRLMNHGYPIPDNRVPNCGDQPLISSLLS